MPRPIDLRYPLQTGEAALGALDFLLVVAFFASFPVPSLDAWFIYLAVGGFAIYAFRQRASDLVFSPEGLGVIGGPQHGKSFAWSEIDAERTRVEPCRHERVVVMNKPASALMLGRRTGEPVEIARSNDADEIASLGDVALAISERIRQAAAPAPIATGSDVLRCTQCSAPIQPVDAAETQCASCHAHCAIPDSLAKQVRHAYAKRDIDRRIRRTLEQPAAPAMNMAIVAVALAMAVGMPLLAWSCFPYLNRILLALGSVGLLSAVVHARLAGRHALRIAAAMACARGADGAPACRACGGPLPAVDPDRAIVPCAYCRAANVLAFTRVRASITVHDARVSLDAFAEARLRMLGRQLVRVLLWGSLTAASLAWIATGWDAGPQQMRGHLLSGGNQPPPAR